MAKCKNCGEEISRLDKDICPFCGTRKPLEGNDNATQDFTKAFDPIECNVEEIKHKSRKIAGILAIFLGVFGAHMFYLNRKKIGFILIAITVMFVATLGSILFFTNAIPNALAFLIPYFVLEIMMIISGIMIFIRHDLVDGDGEFLK